MSEITRIIHESQNGGADTKALFSAAYPELRKLAHARLGSSGPMTLLDTTALVHESWMRLTHQSTLNVENRQKFFAYAAQVMRTVIIDVARERTAARRGGGMKAQSLDTAIGDGIASDVEALRIHEALESLEQVEPRLAQVVEMRYFGGLTEPEIGQILGLTERTVRRDWEKARLLLAAMLV